MDVGDQTLSGGKNEIQESDSVIKFKTYQPKKTNKKKTTERNKKSSKIKHSRVRKSRNKGVENVGLANVDQRKSKSMGRRRHRIFCKWLNWK